MTTAAVRALDPGIAARFRGLSHLIGNTPLVATTLSDSNKKYLSTDLMRSEPVKPGYLSPEVQLLGLESLTRVCAICCDGPDCSEHAKAEIRQADA